MSNVKSTDVLLDYGNEPLVLIGTDETGNSHLLIAVGRCEVEDPYFGVQVNGEIATRVKMGYLDVLGALLTPENGKWSLYSSIQCEGEYTCVKEYSSVEEVPQKFFPGSDFYVG